MFDPDVAKVLETAAEVINERGWCQGIYRKDSGEVCAIGALVTADCRLELGGQAYPRAVGAVSGAAHRLDPEVMSVVEWNDRPGRTKDEVVQLLRDTAEEFR